ncbi:MAG: DUF6095 family protein [Bacteroidota bacterium]
MEETKRTDKTVLVKGLKYLGICALLMFIGPSFLYFIMSNSDKSFYIPLLIIGILICVTAIFMLFLGIKTILDSMFKK